MISHRIPQFINAAWANQWSAGTYVSSTSFTISGNVTGSYVADNAIRVLNAGTLSYSYMVSATYSSPNTTIVIADSILVSGTLSSDYSILPSNSAVGRGFQEVKVIGSRGFSVWSGVTENASVTQAGVMTAISFSGNGANVTNVAWAHLTGIPSLVTSFNGRTGAVVPATSDYNITQLAGVSISSPATNQVLTYNGTNWSNVSPPGSPVTSVFGRGGAVVATAGDYNITQLAGVSISSPSNTQILQYNGTNWVNAAAPASSVTSVFARTGSVIALSSDYSTWYGQLATANTWTGANAFTGGNVSVTSATTTSSLTVTCTFASGGADIVLQTAAAPTITNPAAIFYIPVSTPTYLGLEWWNGTSGFKIFSTGYNGGLPTFLTYRNILDNGSGGATFASSITVSGTCIATTFSGSGASLTSVPWGSLTGVPFLVNTFNGRSGTVSPASGDYSSYYALLSGATFTGIIHGTSAIFSSTISASNFSGSSSGTNTGDQNLAPYALLSGATFTGSISTPAGSSFSGQVHVTNGTGEADIYFGPNSSYLYSNSITDLGVYNPTYGGLFGVSSITGNGFFKGTLAASNFSGSSSGTNTGDQNLAPYALLSGATFTGAVIINSTLTTTGVANFNTSTLESKEQVRPLKLNESGFMNIEPIVYVHKDSQIPMDGLSAENMVNLFPNLVMLKDGKPYALNYSGVIPHAVLMIQSLTKRVCELEQKLNRMN